MKAVAKFLEWGFLLSLSAVVAAPPALAAVPNKNFKRLVWRSVSRFGPALSIKGQRRRRRQGLFSALSKAYSVPD
ncbi:MAG: hypothetical protein ACOYL3_29475, partial [Desulfuromonadaceae bacterium]